MANNLKPRTVAITGAGSGLGREIAVRLAERGYRVFGTTRSLEENDDLVTLSGGRINPVITDITDDEAVRAWAGKVNGELGTRGLDVLISNAGILTPGPLEVLPLDSIRREFAVNVFGGLAVITALLPALRKSRGRIVQIGAMTARFSIPFNGPSSASKAAFEALADVFRLELKPFAIDFVMVQAGNMVTGGPAKTAVAMERIAESMTDEQRSLYGEAFGSFSRALMKAQTSGLSAEASADRIIEIVEQQPAPIRAAVGADAEEILRLVHDKSDAELDALRLQYIGLEDTAAI